MHSILKTGIVFCLMASGFYSCMSDPDFTTNPGKVLTFSTDTLRFDTLFADVPSATRWLKVYNRNKQPLLIADIRLKSDNGEFRINVDGESGTDFKDIEILGKDSIFIAVETTLQSTGKNEPVLSDDAIVFSFNGQQQTVQLEALAWDAIRWNGKVVNNKMTLTADKPYLIYDSLYVGTDALLDIKPGAKLFFHKNARLIVDGSLNAEGTVEQPVLFRGDRLDDMLSGLPYDRVAGQWDGLVFTEKSFDNVLSYCNIHSTVNAIQIKGKETISGAQQLIIKNSIIHNALKSGLTAENAHLLIAGTQITNSGENLVNLNGGVFDFVQCTIANLYSFGPIYGYALNLGATEKPLSIEVRNSIVWGKSRNEIYIPSAAENVIQARFSNSVLKGKEEQSDNFVNIVWNKDPQFRTVNADHFFDFRLDSASVARQLGRQPVAPAPDIDFYGVNRDVEKPDAGAFEYSKIK